VEPDANLACVEPPLGRVLAIHTAGGQDFTTASSRVVLTGTAPDLVSGVPTERITVNGSQGGVLFDATRGRFSFQGALAQGANSFQVRAEGGAQVSAPVEITVTLGGAPTAEAVPSAGGTDHRVGAWLFPWFTGDTGWECSSPWWPATGFASWDGSVAWAKGQLLDMMDANLDWAGVQYDTKDASLPWGVRFTNVVNVIEATRELLDEGYRPPLLIPFVDTAIANQLHLDAYGTNIDVSTEAGRAELYDYLHHFFAQTDAILGPRYSDAAIARYEGRPMVAFWHTDTGSIVGGSNAFVLDLKARFLAERGVEPYVIGHPNFWSQWPDTDEVTLMFGPSSHSQRVGWDGAGKETMNITPGFWNPISNPWYLPREGGVHYATAWAAAQAARALVNHLYIDSWNETGEGSGLFAALVRQYTASDSGSCSTWVHRHDESWGPSSRHYIETTAAQAALWNDLPEDDAVLVAHDLPASLPQGARRLVTVVMRNAGDRAWTAGGGDSLRVTQGTSFAVDLADPIEDSRDEIPYYGGLFRGRPRAFTFEVTAPCAPGSYPLSFRMAKAGSTYYGATVTHTLAVP
jgi:hypothetical protein